LSHQIHYTGYDVALRAVAADLDGEVAPTLFFPKGKNAAAHRATRLGWTDVTERWNEQIGRKLQPTYASDKLDEYKVKIQKLGWHDLRSHAVDVGIVLTKCKRPELEGLLLELCAAKIAQE